MAETANRQKDIFLKAIELPAPGERMAFLAEACAGDDALRQRVEAMLQAHAAPDSFLEKPAAALGATVAAPHGPEENCSAERRPSEGPRTRVGPYKLLEQIGEGGMGVVFMAEQQEPVRRMVALKIIKPGMDSGQVLARFEAERQALALMDHPNIAKVLDASATADGRPFFVMELVKGTPITTFCDANKLSPRHRLELFVPICHAIQHAHQKGVIHRDIKPTNVLIALYDDKPVPKVIDFGIAKAAGQPLTELTLHTGFGALVGTPEYMSPEQATFNQLDIDTRSDVYSLGVLLYELLTGTTPVDKTRLKEVAMLEVLRVVREEEPARPSVKLSTTAARASIAATRGTDSDRLAQLLRGEMDWIVMKSLEKDRNRRYETAAGLARDVDRYLKDELVEARPPSVGYRLRKSVRKNRGPVIAVSLLFLALLAGVVGTTWGLIRALDAEQEAVNKTEEAVVQEGNARLAKERAEQSEEKAKFETLRAVTARHAIQVDLALRAWEQGDMVRMDEFLARIEPAFRDSWEVRHLRDLKRRRVLTLAKQPPSWHEATIAISADGRRIATGYRSPGVDLWDAATGTKLRSLPSNAVAGLALSADGMRLACAEWNGVVTMWDTETGRNLFTTARDDSVQKIALSADGKRMVTVSGDPKPGRRNNGPGWGKIWDAETGKPLAPLQNPPGKDDPLLSVAISGDGRRIVTGGGWNNTVKLWDGLTGQEIPMFFKGPQDGAFRTRYVDISADGKRVVVSDEGFDATLWDIETGPARKIHVLRTAYPLWRSAFSADGQRVFASSLGGDGGLLTVWNANTGVELYQWRCEDIGGAINAFAVSGSGERVVTGSLHMDIRVWNLATRQASFSTGPSADTIGAVAFDPNGEHLYSASAGTWKKWDASSGKEIFSVRVKCDTPLDIRFDVRRIALPANGRRLIAMGPAVRVWDLEKTYPVVNPKNGQPLERWDAQTGAPLLILKGHTGAHVAAAAVSDDGQRIVSDGFDQLLKVWDGSTGEELLTIKGQPGTVRCAAISPDKRRIASSGHGSCAIQVWDAEDGKELLALAGHTRLVESLAFSPDGRTLLSGSADKTMKLWDLATGKERLTLRGHTSDITCLAFSPDGRQIASGSHDHLIKIWDFQTGQDLLTLRDHPGPVFLLAFSHDGRRLASGGGGGGILVWEAP